MEAIALHSPARFDNGASHGERGTHGGFATTTCGPGSGEPSPKTHVANLITLSRDVHRGAMRVATRTVLCNRILGFAAARDGQRGCHGAPAVPAAPGSNDSGHRPAAGGTALPGKGYPRSPQTTGHWPGRWRPGIPSSRLQPRARGAAMKRLEERAARAGRGEVVPG